MRTIEEKVKAIAAETLGIPVEQVTDDARFMEDLGADSLTIVELLMALEEEFGEDIPDEDAEGLHTARQVISYIEKRELEKSA